MSLAVLQDFDALGWPLLEAYGLSENVLPMAMNRIDSARLGTVGRPLAGNQIVIGGDGVIAVRGAGVFTGYLDEAPWDTPAGQGYYATGDLGTLDAAGYLTLTGRTGDIIKTSTGRRVAPVGVEAMLRSFSQDDRDHMVENGVISVTCEFCSATYLFAPEDVQGKPSQSEPPQSGPPETNG